MSFELPMEPADFLEKWLQRNWLEPPLQGIFDEYYSNYRRHFGSYIKEQYNSRFAEALEIIKSCKNHINVLEVGSGCGTESLYFSLLGCHVLGVDLDANRLEVACERKHILEAILRKPLTCEFIRASILDLDISKTFNLIWLEEAFHHLEPRNEIVTLLFRLLKPGGYIVVSETNALNPLIQLSLLRKRGFKTIRSYMDNDGVEHPYGNERIIRASTMKKLFEKEGVSCVSIRHFRISPDLDISDKVVKRIEDLIPSFFKPLFVHYNYVGRR